MNIMEHIRIHLRTTEESIAHPSNIAMQIKCIATIPKMTKNTKTSNTSLNKKTKHDHQIRPPKRYEQRSPKKHCLLLPKTATYYHLKKGGGAKNSTTGPAIVASTDK
jgi:hypothetical protein